MKMRLAIAVTVVLYASLACGQSVNLTGHASQNYTTVQACLNVLNTCGDTCTIADNATYNEYATFKFDGCPLSPMTLTKTPGSTPKLQGVLTNGKKWLNIYGISRNAANPALSDELEITDPNFVNQQMVNVTSSQHIKFRYLYVHEGSQLGKACFNGNGTAPFADDISVMDSDVEFCSALRPTTVLDRYGNPGTCTPGTGCGEGGAAFGMDASDSYFQNVDISHVTDFTYPNGKYTTLHNVSAHHVCGSTLGGGYDITGSHKLCEPDLVDSWNALHLDYVQPTIGSGADCSGLGGSCAINLVVEKAKEYKVYAITHSGATITTPVNLCATNASPSIVFISPSPCSRATISTLFNNTDLEEINYISGGTNLLFTPFKCITLNGDGSCNADRNVTKNGADGSGGTLTRHSHTAVRSWYTSGGTFTNDLQATNASPSVLTSASYTFVTADVGAAFHLVAGTNLTLGITAVCQSLQVSPNGCVLDKNVTTGATATGISGHQVTRVQNAHVGVWQDTTKFTVVSATKTFTFSAAASTIVRGGTNPGSWTTDGFLVNDFFTVASTNSNNGIYQIASISGDGLTLTINTSAGYPAYKTAFVNESITGTGQGPSGQSATIGRTVGAGLQHSIFRYGQISDLGGGGAGIGNQVSTGTINFTYPRALFYNNTYAELLRWYEWNFLSGNSQKSQGGINSYWNFSPNSVDLNNVLDNAIGNNAIWMAVSGMDPSTYYGAEHDYVDASRFTTGSATVDYNKFPKVSGQDNGFNLYGVRPFDAMTNATTGDPTLTQCGLVTGVLNCSDLHPLTGSPILTGAEPLTTVDAADAGGTTLTVTLKPSKSPTIVATTQTGGTDFFQDGQNNTATPDCVVIIHSNLTFATACLQKAGIVDRTHMNLTSSPSRSAGDKIFLYSDAAGEVVFDAQNPAFRGALTVGAPVSPYSLTFNSCAGPGNGTVTRTGGTLSCSCPGGVASGVCSEPFNGGETITLNETPSGGASFITWGGYGITAGCTTTTPCTFTMPAASVSVTAEFATLPTMTVSSNISGCNPSNGPCRGILTVTVANCNVANCAWQAFDVNGKTFTDTTTGLPAVCTFGNSADICGGTPSGTFLIHFTITDFTLPFQTARGFVFLPPDVGVPTAIIPISFGARRAGTYLTY